MNASVATILNAGLFCALENATVKNVVIDSTCAFSGAFSAALSPIVAGTVTVKNVTNMGKIQGTAVGGGLLGKTETTGLVNITIEDSVNSGIVSGRYASGFVASIQNSSNANVFIRNCTNLNRIGKDEGWNAETAEGAFVGQALHNKQLAIHITGCTNNGFVDTNSTSRTVAGGLVGLVLENQNKATIIIEKCINNGNVTVSGDESTYAGGLIACANTNADINITIVQSVNNGIISITKGQKNSTLCGGLVGEVSSNNGATVSVCGCSNTGSIKVNSVTDTFAGGLIGRLGIGSVSATLKNCANKGDVTGPKKW